MHSQHLGAKRSRAMGSHGAKPHTPSFCKSGEEGRKKGVCIPPFRCIEAPGIACASIYSLANRLPAACAAPAGSTTLPFGYALRRREHVLSGKQASSSACGFPSLYRSIIRVWKGRWAVMGQGPLSRSSIKGAPRHSSTTGRLPLRVLTGNYFAPTERLRCSPALIAASCIFFVVIKTDKDFFKNFQRAPLLALFLLYWM